MARIRTVKPEFWSSPDTAAVPDPWARLLYIAMWNWADDFGRGTANPKELAGFAFPNDESITAADIRRMLGGIRRGFGVKFYKLGGRTYYAIPSWGLHQKVDHRATTSRHPSPDEGDDWDPDLDPPPDQHRNGNPGGSTDTPPTTHRGIGGNHPVTGGNSAGAPRVAPTPPITDDHENSVHDRNPDDDTRSDVPKGPDSAESRGDPPRTRRSLGAGSRKLEVGKSQNTSPRSAHGEDQFDQFYAAFPRHVDRLDAQRAWSKATKTHPPDQIIQAAKRYANLCRGKDKRYVKHPATWLNKGGYLDEEPDLRLVSGDGIHRDPKTGRAVEW